MSEPTGVPNQPGGAPNRLGAEPNSPGGVAGAPDEKSSRNTLIVIGFLSVALVMYMAILGRSGIDLIGEGDPVAVGFGIGLLVLPILGAWMLWATLRAGFAHQRLVRLARERGADLDASALPRRASGRIERGAADELFASLRPEWDADPDSWLTNYRLARAYDYAGDRGRARKFMTAAVRLERAQSGPADDGGAAPDPTES